MRDATAVTFGTLVGIAGERAMQPYLSKLDKIKLAKVKEHTPQIAPPPTGAPAPAQDNAMDLSEFEDKKEDKKAQDKKAPPGKKSLDKKPTEESDR